jgi:hypothetical protein
MRFASHYLGGVVYKIATNNSNSFTFIFPDKKPVPDFNFLLNFLA